MAASSTDKARKSYSFTTKSLGANVDSSATTFSLNNATNVPTDTAVDFIIDRVDSNGTSTPTKRELCKGVVSGSNITSVTRGLHGTTAQAHTAGAVIEFVASGAAWNDLIDLIIAQHNQDGTHGAVTATSVTTTGAVTAGNGLTLTAGTLSLPSASINQAALPLGAVVQVVDATFSAVATGTTLIPLDDTIPQITEGNEYMTLAITPKSATNKLVISVNAYAAHSTNTILSMALFQDATANAIAATAVTPSANDGNTISLKYPMVAGTTSSITFWVRIGANDAGTTTFNGRAGGRNFGAIAKSSIVITEYKA